MEIVIDFKKIKDWKSFHDQFSEVMGFPNFYGENMNAWIDCMSYIDDTDAAMSGHYCNPGKIAGYYCSRHRRSIK